jgi:endonuclease/exonuclease/phosphatase family metal-dependent hydrolase
MPDLKVATLNLRNRADRWSERRHLVVAQLLDAAPDLVSLQEISFPAGQGRWLRNQLNIRLSGSSNEPYRLVQKRRRHLWAGYLEGIGVLTKWPIKYHDWLPLGYGGRLALRINVELSLRHQLDFVSVHLHHISFERQAREEQAIQLCGWLQGDRPVPWQIVAGDFNETPDGPAIEVMKRRFRSAYTSVHGHEPLATFPTALSQRADGWSGCLDYIFVSPDVGQVTSSSIFCNTPASTDPALFPSDHVGLLATIRTGD